VTGRLVLGGAERALERDEPPAPVSDEDTRTSRRSHRGEDWRDSIRRSISRCHSARPLAASIAYRQ